jgi:hypothetical protein
MFTKSGTTTSEPTPLERIEHKLAVIHAVAHGKPPPIAPWEAPLTLPSPPETAEASATPLKASAAKGAAVSENQRRGTSKNKVAPRSLVENKPHKPVAHTSPKPNRESPRPVAIAKTSPAQIASAAVEARAHGIPREHPSLNPPPMAFLLEKQQAVRELLIHAGFSSHSANTTDQVHTVFLKYHELVRVGNCSRVEQINARYAVGRIFQKSGGGIREALTFADAIAQLLGSTTEEALVGSKERAKDIIANKPTNKPLGGAA